MEKFVITLILIATVQLNTAQAQTCSELFKTQSITQASYDAGFYLGRLSWEFREVGPGRILFRPVERDPRPGPYNGFLTDLTSYYAGDGVAYRALKKAIQFIPRRVLGLLRGEGGRLRGLVRGDPTYAVTVTNGLQYSFLDRPIYASSNLAKLKRRYASSLLLSLVAVGGSGVAFQMKVVEPYLETKNAAIVQNAVAEAAHVNRTALLENLQYDVRNRDIREMLESALVRSKTKADRDAEYEIAIELVLIRAKSTRSFLQEFRIEEFQPTHESLRELRRYPQFEHLSSRIPAATEPLDEATWKKIVQLNWVFHTMIELAPAFLNEKLRGQSEVMDPAIRAAYEKVYSGTFMLLVREQYTKRELTLQQARSLIGEVLLYRTRLAEAKSLAPTKPFPASSAGFEERLMTEARLHRERWNLP